METIKTAVVVVLLLAVLYGVYVVLNKPELTPPSDAGAWNESAQPLEIDTGMASGLDRLSPPPLTPQDAPPAPAPLVSGEPQGASGLALQTPQGAVTKLSNAVETQALPATAGQPTLADPSAAAVSPPPAVAPSPAELASANVPVAASSTPPAPPAPATTEAPLTAGPPTPAEPAAESPGSVYAQAPSPAGETPPPPDRGDFRSVRAFDNAWNSALAQLQKGQWAEALLTLSFFFHDPEITGEERQRLIDLMDPLAGKVIYSSEHTLEAPHEVQPGEQLDVIAQQYELPVSLLQSINGIAQPESLRPGTQLKVLRGPFRAEIDLKRNELVLFLGKYYAGRFAISVGNDPAPQPTECQVAGKEAGHEYVGRDGVRIPARAADNPYGGMYLDLGNGVCVHGSPDKIPTHAGLGCISLSTADVTDVANILSIGSKVTIR